MNLVELIDRTNFLLKKYGCTCHEVNAFSLKKIR